MVLSKTRRIIKRGGKGSGHHGHGGLPGVHGGSTSSGGGAPVWDDFESQEDFEAASEKYYKSFRGDMPLREKQDIITHYMQYNLVGIEPALLTNNTRDYHIFIDPDGELHIGRGRTHGESAEDTMEALGYDFLQEFSDIQKYEYPEQFLALNLLQRLGYIRFGVSFNTIDRDKPSLYFEFDKPLTRRQSKTVEDIIFGVQNRREVVYDVNTSLPESGEEHREEGDYQTGRDENELLRLIGRAISPSRRIIKRGGKGSGHHGHGGLPGVHGGSTSSGGGTKKQKKLKAVFNDYGVLDDARVDAMHSEGWESGLQQHILGQALSAADELVPKRMMRGTMEDLKKGLAKEINKHTETYESIREYLGLTEEEFRGLGEDEIELMLKAKGLEKFLTDFDSQEYIDRILRNDRLIMVSTDLRKEMRAEYGNSSNATSFFVGVDDDNEEVGIAVLNENYVDYGSYLDHVGSWNGSSDDVDFGGDYLEVQYLVSRWTGEGIGSEMMQLVFDHAAENEQGVFLGSVPQAEEFYELLGGIWVGEDEREDGINLYAWPPDEVARIAEEEMFINRMIIMKTIKEPKDGVFASKISDEFWAEYDMRFIGAGIELPDGVERSVSLSRRIIKRGGKGSGNFGHGGLKGVHGGSSTTGGGGGIAGTATIRPIPGGSAALLKEPTTQNGQEITSITTDDWVALAQRKYDELSDEEKERIAEIEKKLKENPSTMELFYDPETGEWDEEREKLHDEIIEKLLEGVEPQETLEALFTGGLPGSGKSSVLRAMELDTSEYVHLDSDEIKAMLPEYEGWNAGLVHEESAHVLGRVLKEAVNNKLSVVFDSTMRSENKFRQILNSFGDLGYNTQVVFVDIPMDVSIDRALLRFQNSGRYVSPFYIATHDTKNRATLEAIQSEVDRWALWDNSVHGQPPTEVATSGD